MEDSHYCLKCGSTLVGLNNYINHRKAPCDSVTSTKMYDDTMSCGSIKIELDGVKLVEEDRSFEADKKSEKVEADDFFSSLELQSSSKSSTNAGNHSTVQSKSSSGIVTRSKTLLTSYQDIKLPKKTESKSNKPKISRKTMKSKQRRLLKPKKMGKTTEVKKSSVKDKKETNQKKQCINVVKIDEDNGVRSGLDKVGEDDEWNLFGHLMMKKDEKDAPVCIRRYTPELFSMSPILELSEDKDVEVDKFLEDEDYDEDDAYLNLDDVDEFDYNPPRSHTGGKWKPGSLSVRTSPMLWPSQAWDNILEEEGRTSSVESPTEPRAPPISGGKWKSYNPPSTHTGGKWKPSEVPQVPKKVQDFPPASHTGGKWHPGKRMPSEPPATHTGGKWKPQISPNQPVATTVKWPASSSKGVDNKTLNVIASCQSTSGKCLKTAGGLIQYYCSPCNRRLASKKMYKKHVLSELHLKRVLQDNELEFDSRSIKMFRGLFSVMNNKQRGLGKREIKKPEFFKDMDMGGGKRTTNDGKSTKVTRRRMPRRELIRCDICRAKLSSHQLGKHLVSYYHSRRIRLDDPEQQKLVLDNIHTIVKQAPYQCGICKFYFNTHKLFKNHWTSNEHKWMEDTSGKKFWCVLCNFECETSRSMELHLDSNSHREVIMAVNKSIPIIIRQKQILNCKFCDKKFRYNFALIRHNRISHGQSEADSQKVNPCLQCKYKSKTLKSLQRHILRRHKDTDKVPYFCSRCELYFSTAEDAGNHRKSQEHRSRGKELSSTSHSCPYCSITVADIKKLKVHIDEQHPELQSKCSKCGITFTLRQELAQHRKSCTFPDAKSQSTELYNCGMCAYSSSLKADVLYHETLHKARVESQKLQCPVCDRGYRMFALKVHLRTHTGERPYACRMCSKTFIRRSRLLTHMKFEHQDTADEDNPNDVKKKSKTEGKPTERTVYGPSCGDTKCKYIAKDADDLEYHSRVHIGRKLFQCPFCNYQAKTNTLLKRHNKIHLDERSYPCPHCPFRGRLASHLKRHLRLHTGAKPYKCPHCPYQCNILENLRKHVLYTKIHPGKNLYECKMCNYSSNSSKEFKQHLIDNHGDKFGTEVAVTAYIAGIYNVDEDVQTAVNPVPIKQKKVSTPPKADRETVLKNIAILSKKFEPIAPKPADGDRRAKSLGNSIQDKRKLLEMELEKLKNQVKRKPLRSYPTPTILKAERDMKLRGQQVRKEAEGVAKSHLTVAINQMEAQAEDPSPTYILYESGISFEDNEEHLAEQEFYL